MTVVEAMPVEVPGIREGAAAGIRGIALAGARLVRTTDEGGRKGQEDETRDRTHEMCFHSDESDANASGTFKRMWARGNRKAKRQGFSHSLTSPSKQSTKFHRYAVTFARCLQREAALIIGSSKRYIAYRDRSDRSRHMHARRNMNHKLNMALAKHCRASGQ